MIRRAARARDAIRDRCADCKSKFNNADCAGPTDHFQLISIRPLRPVRRSENVLGLQRFHQLAHQSALELGLGYAMPRVKVNNRVTTVREEPSTAYHFDSVRFHLKF